MAGVLRPVRTRAGPSKGKTLKIQRAALSAIVLVGVLLAVFPVATGMFGKTSGVEKLTGDFRASFTTDAVAQTRTDLDGIVAMSSELQTKTLPALPEALGMTPEDFSAFLGTAYPDVAAGIPQLEAIIPRFEALVAGFEAQAPNFREADSIPTSSLSSRVVPYLFLVPGLLLIGLGAAGLARRNGRAPRVALVAAAVVGVGLAGGALVLSVHSKGEAVDAMTEAFAPVFTDAGVEQARLDLAVVQSTAAELQTEALPGLATALGMSNEEFMGFIAANFPDVAAGVSSLDTVLPRFETLVNGIDANIGSFQQASDLPTGSMPATSLAWWLIVPGVLLVLVPVGALFAARSPRSRDEHDLVMAATS